MDPWTLAALLASAALSYYSQDQAIKKQTNAANEASARQMQMQNQATAEVAKKAGEFDATNRLQNQNELAQQLTDQYQGQVQAQPITAQGVQVGATVPEGQQTADYVIAKAKEQAKATDSARKLAALMGRTGAASQMRQDEAIGLGDLGGTLGRIQTNANNVWGVDQANIATASRPSLGATVGAAALQGYGLSRAYGNMGGPSGGVTQSAPVGNTGAYDLSWLGSTQRSARPLTVGTL